MVCPYCLGRFNVTHSQEESTERIKWALLRCRCFEFPIVDGVLLLSLAKAGYGGSEEVLAPYVPLQVAAFEYLRKGDVTGLRHWIERHVPLLHKLMAPQPLDYMTFYKQLSARLWPQVQKDLFSWNQYEVLGRRGAHKKEGGLRDAVGSTLVGYGLLRARSRLLPPRIWTNFYFIRFTSNELRTRLRNICFKGPLLSLCCGQGPFELFLSGHAPKAPVVSIDGQVLNLFIVKRFIAPYSNYICHDVQFALPFEDGAFSEVFSSTCLNEVASQAHFIRESCRVTSESGWTMFDTVTPDESTRVAPKRFYRVCQNHFASLEDYRKLMTECADGRAVSFTSLERPEPCWTDNVNALSSAPSATFILKGSGSSFEIKEQSGFTSEERALLVVNPRYQVRVEQSKLSGRLRLGERMRAKRKRLKSDGMLTEILIDRRRLDDSTYLDELYRSGAIVLLPKHFGRDVVRLFSPTDPGGGNRADPPI
jgi:hypothetical protein